MTHSIDNISGLRLMVRGAYDLQALRMQTGLRLCANFRAKLKDQLPEPTEDEEDPDAELSAEAEKIIDRLKESYRRLTDGVARNRTLPDERKFDGDPLISTFTELTLVDQYMRIEAQESLAFRQMVSTLEKIPIYTSYLKNTVGVGPAMAAVLITYLDPHKARHASSFWMYAGIDVAPDGAGRSRRREHLVEREYINKAGEVSTRLGTTYNPFLKTKLSGVLATSFLRSASPWREAYNNYKHRILSDPARIKVTVAEWKRRHKAGEEMKQFWAPGRIHKASMRYMLKLFLADFWARWRALEKLPVTEPYYVAKLGMPAHRAA